MLLKVLLLLLKLFEIRGSNTLRTPLEPAKNYFKSYPRVMSAEECGTCKDWQDCVWNGSEFECDCKKNFIKGNLGCYECNCTSHSHCILDKDGANEKSMCRCEEGYSLENEVCKADVCKSNPCESGGTCIRQLETNYKCICAENYMGENCELVAACQLNPCKNGGVCEVTQNGKGYNCSCVENFTGENCELASICAGNPCLNGATCTLEENEENYMCVCSNGFTGKNCEMASFCARNPCLNGATCTLGENGDNYTCVCNNNFTGKNCEIKCDEECADEEQCLLKDDKLECSCKDNFIRGLLGCLECDCQMNSICMSAEEDGNEFAKCECMEGYHIENDVCKEDSSTAMTITESSTSSNGVTTLTTEKDSDASVVITDDSSASVAVTNDSNAILITESGKTTTIAAKDVVTTQKLQQTTTDYIGTKFSSGVKATDSTVIRTSEGKVVIISTSTQWTELTSKVIELIKTNSVTNLVSNHLTKSRLTTDSISSTNNTDSQVSSTEAATIDEKNVAKGNTSAIICGTTVAVLLALIVVLSGIKYKRIRRMRRNKGYYFQDIETSSNGSSRCNCNVPTSGETQTVI